MKRLRHVIVGIVTVGAVALLCSVPQAQTYFVAVRGRLAARSDVSHGRYIVMVYGYGTPRRYEYALILQEEHGIELREVAGCIVPRTVSSYADAYDEVSVPAAKRLFGPNVFEESYQKIPERPSPTPAL